MFGLKSHGVFLTAWGMFALVIACLYVLEDSKQYKFQQQIGKSEKEIRLLSYDEVALRNQYDSATTEVRVIRAIRRIGLNLSKTPKGIEIARNP